MPKNIFAHENVVKWCPGCGDYAVLKHLQQALARSELQPHQVALISGIGCSSRLPHYVKSFGFHTVHGRAPTVLTGLAQSRDDLKTLLITGDGDGLSIGLGHLLHLVRRHIPTTVLLLNNKIYGLTKGQNSPTTQQGLKTKMTPQGHTDQPLDCASMVLAAGGEFFGRCYDTQGTLLQELIIASLAHKGCSVIEIYQSCPIFNKEAFSASEKKLTADHHAAQFWPGQPTFLQGKPISFTQGQWQQADQACSYQPHSLSSWALLQEKFLSLGLLWAPQYCLEKENQREIDEQNKDLDFNSSQEKSFDNLASDRKLGHPANLTESECQSILDLLYE